MKPLLVSAQPGQTLARDDFKHVVALTPLVSIDLIVRNAAGDMLVGLRCNRPARGTWFVPGGRISKNETLDAAFRRICSDELGLHQERRDARALGVFEHFYDDNFSGEDAFGTHYVVLGYEFVIAGAGLSLPKAQHTDYRWLSDTAILASPEVHENTKAYSRLARGG